MKESAKGRFFENRLIFGSRGVKRQFCFGKMYLKFNFTIYADFFQFIFFILEGAVH